MKIVIKKDRELDIRKNEVLLVFKSEDEKKYFLGGLSDGWGENIVDLDWDWRKDLYDAKIVKVINFKDNDE